MAKAYSVHADFQRQRAEHVETSMLHWPPRATNAEALSHRLQCENNSIKSDCANARAETSTLRQKLETLSQTVQHAIIEAQTDIYLPLSVPVVHTSETEEVETLQDEMEDLFKPSNFSPSGQETDAIF